jgi:hypothetical protein
VETSEAAHLETGYFVAFQRKKHDGDVQEAESGMAK